MSQVGRGGGQGQSLISLAICLRGNFGPSGKWAASSGTFKRLGAHAHRELKSPRDLQKASAGVAIRAPATQTLPPVAGEGKLAASSMECMAKVIDPSGSVDQTKWHACNAANIINMSFVKFLVDHPPSKTVCPTPRIYPGSTTDNEEVYGKLPSGLTVRHPTSCP